MQTIISSAVSRLETAADAIRNIMRKGSEKYFTAMDNMFLHDDIFEHEAFR